MWKEDCEPHLARHGSFTVVSAFGIEIGIIQLTLQELGLRIARC